MFREQTRVNRDPPAEWYREIPLDRDIARFLYWDLAERTRSNDSTAQKSYILYYGIHGILAFPVTIRSLSSWITKMGLRRLLNKSIKLYMTGLQSYYVELRASKQKLEIFHTPFLQQVIAGIRRFNEEPDVKERHPITWPVLHAMLALLDKNTRKRANLYAVFCLAFTGFLQMGEFTWACGKLNPDFRRGISRVVRFYWATTDYNCHSNCLKPIPSVRELHLKLLPPETNLVQLRLSNTCLRGFLPPLTALYLTRAMDSSDNLSQKHFEISSRNRVLLATILGHSFWQDAATSARKAGLSDAEILLLGQ